MTSREKYISDILAEDNRRMGILHAKFNPITGEFSIGERTVVTIKDYPIKKQWIPSEMLDEPFVKKIVSCGSIKKFVENEMGVCVGEYEYNLVLDMFHKTRIKYDFPYWAASEAYIKRKGGGDDVLFRLTHPQRKFVRRLEELRKAGKPIRIIMLKARQWGGSTTSQLYMAWLQLVHEVGLNSLIVAHQGTASDEIKDMFDRMIKHYPVKLLHNINDTYNESEPKMVGVGKSGNIFRIPQRNCKVKIGTAERPDSCRGGDYNLVHLSEVGIWKDTEGKSPKDIVRSACKGVLYKPHTMIVYESTANGVGNFFHTEYISARDNPRSQFKSMFVPWFDIEMYTLPFSDSHSDDQPAYTTSREAFAEWLYDNRENENEPSDREESGRYLWYLWNLGATLEGINWYMIERAQVDNHGSMASECPSDDTEAFVNSGSQVFDKYKVEPLRKACKQPTHVGEIYSMSDIGRESIDSLRFKEDGRGSLWVWALPDPYDPQYIVRDRYLTVVDIGGRSSKADWSVIVVYDRFEMMDGGKPSVVAQWYGHCDIDILAWKAAQIAAFYDNSLLVIESNTIETHERDRDVDGDQSHYILNQIKDVYPNLYAREQSEEDIRNGLPRKYGFHTNVSTKPTIISMLVKVVREGMYIERDRRCLDEMLVYEKKQNGSYGAVKGAHDDLLMTRAIGMYICYSKMDIPTVIDMNDSSSVTSVKKVVSEATL